MVVAAINGIDGLSCPSPDGAFYCFVDAKPLMERFGGDDGKLALHLLEHGVAVVAASGILGFAALAGSRPEMKISFGDVMVAVIGIGVVLVIVISVLFATQDETHAEEEPAEAAVTQMALL